MIPQFTMPQRTLLVYPENGRVVRKRRPMLFVRRCAGREVYRRPASIAAADGALGAAIRLAPTEALAAFPSKGGR